MIGHIIASNRSYQVPAPNDTDSTLWYPAQGAQCMVHCDIFFFLRTGPWKERIDDTRKLIKSHSGIVKMTKLSYLFIFFIARAEGFLPNVHKTLSRTSVLYSSLLPDSAYQTILEGRIAVVPNFLSQELVGELRDDAASLYRDGHFSADALAAYGTEQDAKFDPSKDRTVLKLAQWKRNDIGNAKLRHETFGNIMASLRTDLSINLNRPKLDGGKSTNMYGFGSTEISYTRFGPGAYLKRHIDEHHEELKGKRGWEKPTRRSVSWLVYLNEPDWEPREHGGFIRCFQRKNRPSSNVGALGNGDLQIGWLRATAQDSVERPVFLDGRRQGNDGICAMYTVVPGDADDNVRYISRNFNPDPVLFLSGGDFFARRLLIDRPDLAPRFHFLEAPKSAFSDIFGANKTPSDPYTDEDVLDVPPLGGTLVVFDSVSLPHEVLPAFKRERWAASGWYHEDQQEEAFYHHAQQAKQS